MEMGDTMDDISAEELISHLGLVRHPEGGWYRETYRSAGSIPGDRVTVSRLQLSRFLVCLTHTTDFRVKGGCYVR